MCRRMVRLESCFGEARECGEWFWFKDCRGSVQSHVSIISQPTAATNTSIFVYCLAVAFTMISVFVVLR